MAKISIKENYLLSVIVMGLLVLCMYSTYALFLKTKTTTNNIINMTASLLPLDSEMAEYQKVTISANSVQTIEVTVDNSTNSTLYYGVWYQMVDEVLTDIVCYSSLSDYTPTGTINASGSKEVTLVADNYTDRDIVFYIGLANSVTSSLNISSPRALVTNVYNMSATDVVPEYSGSQVTNVFDYTGSETAFPVTSSTNYTLETWGAQGGSYSQTSSPGGYGAYAKGIIALNKITTPTLYINVGGQGSYGTSSTYTAVSGGGYNGGGNAGYRGGAGGGATHIATKSGLLSSVPVTNLLIASGGGGGAYYYSTTYKATGGHAGGISGSDGGVYSASYTTYRGLGGNQTAGGGSGTALTNAFSGYSGSYGIGGDTGYKYNNTDYYSSGAGGGGYYGGGGADNDNTARSRVRYASGGGGGSSYIARDNLTDKFVYCYSCTANTAVNTYTYNVTSVNATATANTAKSGNGYAKITYIPKYGRVDLTGISELRIDPGTIYDLSTGVVCEDNGYGCTISSIKPATTTNLSEGTYTVTYYVNDTAGNVYKFYRTLKVKYACREQVEYSFAYTGGIQELDLECAGTYKLEVWGAQGGSSAPSVGGNGGYSVGTVNLSDSDELYVYVGLQGNVFNGGGSGTYVNGGGATDIRINQDSLYARVIVAGGGGGSHYCGTSYCGNGGLGGGTTGSAGAGYSASSTSYGIGGGSGTQIAGGAAGYAYYTNYYNGTAGAFGVGGNSLTPYNATCFGGAGGGGWYGGGGGGGFYSAGGGGSGWIYTSSTYSTWCSGNSSACSNWLLNSNYYLTNASTSNGSTLIDNPDGTQSNGHAGNGHARITFIPD